MRKRVVGAEAADRVNLPLRRTTADETESHHIDRRTRCGVYHPRFRRVHVSVRSRTRRQPFTYARRGIANDSQPARTRQRTEATKAKGFHRINAKSCRLLLRDAMQRTAAPDEFKTVDGNDLPARETAREQLGRSGVAFGLAERGHQHRTVEDQKIRVAGRHLLPVANARERQREFDDLEFPARRRAQRVQPLEIIAQRPVIFLARVALDDSSRCRPRKRTG